MARNHYICNMLLGVLRYIPIESVPCCRSQANVGLYSSVWSCYKRHASSQTVPGDLEKKSLLSQLCRQQKQQRKLTVQPTQYVGAQLVDVHPFTSCMIHADKCCSHHCTLMWHCNFARKCACILYTHYPVRFHCSSNRLEWIQLVCLTGGSAKVQFAPSIAYNRKEILYTVYKWLYGIYSNRRAL